MVLLLDTFQSHPPLKHPRGFLWLGSLAAKSCSHPPLLLPSLSAVTIPEKLNRILSPTFCPTAPGALEKMGCSLGVQSLNSECSLLATKRESAVSADRERTTNDNDS